jgi:uncharacterized protein YbaP (TraB family)
MNWTRRSLLVAGAAGAAGLSLTPSLSWAAKDADVYPFWEVRKGNARVYLFGDGGSVTDPWSSPRIEAAFDASAVFWKETPDTPADRAKVIAAGVDRARPLSTWLTAEQKERVAAAAVNAGTTYAALEPVKPWLAALVMSSAYSQKKAALPGPRAPGEAAASDPIAVLTARAKAAGKPIRTEYPDQDSLLAWAVAMSPQAQVEYLLYIIENNEQPSEHMAQRKREWAVGDMAPETREVARIKQAYPNLFEPLDGERNRGWPPRVRKMLDDGGTSFVLVGCDHLLGPDSVLAQLAKAGLPARRI